MANPLRLSSRWARPMVALVFGGLSWVLWTPSAGAALSMFDSVVGFGAAAVVAPNFLATSPVAMASMPDAAGYWVVDAAGAVTAAGAASDLGSVATALNSPIVGMAATPDGLGYWLVAADGGIFAYGDAAFEGSAVATALNSPIVGMAATPDGLGYWLVAADGGIFAYGDAAFEGSGTTMDGEDPVTAIAADGAGYWLAFSGLAPVATVLGQEQRLSELGYLPLNWSGSTFTWRWTDTPVQLKDLWQPSTDNDVLTGALYAFESVSGLGLDTGFSPAEITKLTAAVASDRTDPNGYTYALASQAQPESLTIWHNGVDVVTTPANTGISVAPTQVGTWPVYKRFRYDVMKGTEPDGAHYADPVQFVSYFHGGDALHYMPRARYGFPQSLGCVELPYAGAEAVWPYTTIGSLVTVD